MALCIRLTFYLDLSGCQDENRLKGGKDRSRETSEEMNAILQLRDENQDEEQDSE